MTETKTESGAGALVNAAIGLVGARALIGVTKALGAAKPKAPMFINGALGVALLIYATKKPLDHTGVVPLVAGARLLEEALSSLPGAPPMVSQALRVLEPLLRPTR
jgi:uncharacterized membrane protein YeaQ/YmgE (transglycosylase-associated protein family)